ncbi:hypothetical protein [Agrococcus sp. TF02-05]|uniref:hypothetical protein n=1 Tax=Agrococcus sp. TF02-05 TaxID=2815211 RepID=UPI001AA19DFE|nr:hypothetical protein [Agrococcus sp. TF02-05]MBO1769627.1 hypothetical protein [Agrococcus sp. TF02-05]
MRGIEQREHRRGINLEVVSWDDLDSVEGGPDPACPASALQLHPDALVLVDEAAASRPSARAVAERR